MDEQWSPVGKDQTRGRQHPGRQAACAACSLAAHPPRLVGWGTWTRCSNQGASMSSPYCCSVKAARGQPRPVTLCPPAGRGLGGTTCADVPTHSGQAQDGARFILSRGSHEMLARRSAVKPADQDRAGRAIYKVWSQTQGNPLPSARKRQEPNGQWARDVNR